MRRLLLVLGLLMACAAPALAEEPASAAQTVDSIIAKGDAVIAAYDPAKRLVAADAISDLYFDGFEGMENALGAVDPGLKQSAEAKFGQLIGKARKGEPPATVAAAWSDLKVDLRQVPARLDKGHSGAFLTTLLQSFLILVREGFEAMLVITALIAYLRRAGQPDKLKVVYHGVGWALVASLLTAWATSALVPVSGEGREAMEGGTMLLAAVVLFYCSYWLFAKREAARWQQYVKAQVDQALSGGRLYALGFAAFLAVYREGAETVLFYQALSASAPGQGLALGLGLGGAVLALVGIYVAMNLLSVRLPLRLFFSATAGLLYYLALDFAGNGVVELQNGRLLPITPLPGWPSLEWLGLYPTLEGVVAQAVLVAPLLVALGGWLVVRRGMTRRGAARPEDSRAEDSRPGDSRPEDVGAELQKAARS